MPVISAAQRSGMA